MGCAGVRGVRRSWASLATASAGVSRTRSLPRLASSIDGDLPRAVALLEAALVAGIHAGTVSDADARAIAGRVLARSTEIHGRRSSAGPRVQVLRDWTDPEEGEEQDRVRAQSKGECSVSARDSDLESEQARAVGLTTELAQDRAQPAKAVHRSRTQPQIVASKHLADEDEAVTPDSLRATLSDLLVDTASWQKIVKGLSGTGQEKGFASRRFRRQPGNA